MIKDPTQLNTAQFPTWCPGCGDFGIWASIKNAVAQLDTPLEQIVFVYGIGCSGNMASFIKGYGFHGLHGRAIPVAEGIKTANHRLKVIIVGGDGDLLGEGLSHLIHACRANHDLTVILHNNQIYGLTTGQSSPTSLKESTGKTTPYGVVDEPINPIQLALTVGATHTIRAYAGNIPHLTDKIKEGIDHPGFSLVEVLQPCVTFNKLNTHQWFQERIKIIDQPLQSRLQAISKATWTDSEINIGTFYQETKPVFTATIPPLKDQTLLQNSPSENDLTSLINLHR